MSSDEYWLIVFVELSRATTWTATKENAMARITPDLTAARSTPSRIV
jgi:hypothetical protein